MIRMKYDNVNIFDVHSDVLLKAKLRKLPGKIAAKLGITAECTTGTDTSTYRNTLLITNLANITTQISKDTILLNLGNILTDGNIPATLDITSNFATDLVISYERISILQGRTHNILLYNKEKNVIVIDSAVYDNSKFLDYLHIIEEYNVRNNITRNTFKIGELLMGADPEFVLVDPTGSIVPANNLIKDGTNGKVGTDGHSATGEFRPDPSNSTHGLVKNMKKLYSDLNHILSESSRSDVNVSVGGGGVLNTSLGGHIHFSIPPSTSLIRMLDDFIGRPLKSIAGSKRSSEEYGILGDHREQPHGFEYRTPPSFIGTPAMFTQVMTVARCVALTWIDIYNDNDSKEFSYNTAPSLDDYLKLKDAAKYTQIITNFYNFVLSPAANLHVSDALAAWKCKKSAVPVKKKVIVVGSADKNIGEVARLINLSAIEILTNRKVYIYGIGENRGIDRIIMMLDETSIESSPVHSIVSYATREDMDNTYGFFPSGANEYDIVIGVPYKFRNDITNLTGIVGTILSELTNILS